MHWLPDWQTNRDRQIQRTESVVIGKLTHKLNIDRYTGQLFDQFYVCWTVRQTDPFPIGQPKEYSLKIVSVYSCANELYCELFTAPTSGVILIQSIA